MCCLSGSYFKTSLPYGIYFHDVSKKLEDKIKKIVIVRLHNSTVSAVCVVSHMFIWKTQITCFFRLSAFAALQNKTRLEALDMHYPVHSLWKNKEHVLHVMVGKAHY